ncbi:diguanylate cyclase (GGDEF) domain-containing protein [Bryocella elongata]|uniref:diguanylate cyclase n=1 Tax=Bryocella elongata TaxID=863522 RepID=A0A1H6BJ86_9BACT|nr:diguanylate cyclase [Bryocella elongata]SEG60465.1 diguanylate cyclase (GGDEF) domain-containing protein [Bryocella elongata]
MSELTVRYLPWLVVASVATSIASAYAALTLADRMRASTTVLQRTIWLSGGSIALGGGIWSMHYLGMLAVVLPVEVLYHWPTVILSALMAVAASAVVLEQISHAETTRRRLLASALLMAAGIGGMHYTGMAAMRSRAMEVYQPWGIVLAVAAAGVFAWTSLAVASRATNCTRCRTILRRTLASSLMGIGIAAMHYTAMATVHFHDMGAEPDLAHTIHVGLLGSCGVGILTAIVLLGTLAGAAFDERRITALSEAHEQLRKAHEQLSDAHNQLNSANEELRMINEELEGTQQELLRMQASLCEMTVELNELSIRDGLTGVFNRRHFDRMLTTEFRRAVRRQGPVALIMIDLDHFKHLNDTHGHQHGDHCLKEIGKMLLEVPKRGYDMVSRYGGEEFAILMPEASLESAARKAEDIRQRALDLKLPNDGNPAAGGVVSLSIGVCVLWPQVGDHPELLIHEADTALYRAKRAGRNRVEMADCETEAA